MGQRLAKVQNFRNRAKYYANLHAKARMFINNSLERCFAYFTRFQGKVIADNSQQLVSFNNTKRVVMYTSSVTVVVL